MNRFNSALLPLFLVLALVSLTAQAETLSDQKIRSFIGSMKSLQSMEGEFEELPDGASTSQGGNTLGMPDMSRVFSSSLEQMKGHEMYSRLEEVVEQHGFASAEQWAEAGDRIFQAWSALEMGQQSGEMTQEMANAMDEINNNPNMSEAQKEQMRAMMGGAMSAVQQAANAPEADKRAVRPHMDALRAAIGSDR